jgi:RNA polymerase sigma factor (sigma-70 family)
VNLPVHRLCGRKVEFLAGLFCVCIFEAGRYIEAVKNINPIIMNINDLYQKACAGGTDAEHHLFQNLSARFRLVARHRIWHREDAEEVVQDSLAIVVRKYREVNIESSFAAWAQRILDLNILEYIRKKGQLSKRFEPLPEEDTTSMADHPNPSLKLKLLNCLKKLSRVNRRHARILVFIYQGYGVEEVCEKLELTVNNYYSVLSRARSMMETCLEKGKVR